MLRPVILLCLLASGSTEAAPEECSVKPDGTSTCSRSDQTTLMQSLVRVSLETEFSASSRQHVYGPSKKSKPLLDYFVGWAQGKIDNRLARIMPDDSENDVSTLETATEVMSSAVASKLFESKAMQDCPEKAVSLLGQTQFEVLHATPPNANQIQHTLLKGKGAQLQYMASYQFANGDHQVFVADPPACSPTGQLAFLGIPDNISSDDLVDANVAKSTRRSGGESGELDLNDDLVHDCKELFIRTLKDNCDKDADIKVKHANLHIVDGLDVMMKVDVCKPNTTENCKGHEPECAFETCPECTDASLLQAGRGASHTLAVETPGSKATLKLSVSLCDVDEVEGANATEAAEDAFLAQFGMGENSRSKGFEHVYDNFPVYSAVEVETPTQLDLRTKHPRCYPALQGLGPGTETVRNQGTCGSCWAYASATTTMINLCISGDGSHALKNEHDRYEISTQQIMSCRFQCDKPEPSGCQGGNMNDFNTQARAYGLTKERDNPYKCGAGDPQKHFASKNHCDKFPWGGTCASHLQDSNWFWGGAAKIDGEDNMKNALASGASLYVTMDIYKNFVDWGDGVYSHKSGARRGGHAMNSLGYGIEGQKKYWLIQNSWGTSGWGVEGYGKILRGEDLCGIETGSFVPRVWVKGGKQPTCKDNENGSGLSQTGGVPYLKCSQIPERYCGGSTMAANCPQTCGKCGGSNGAEAPAPTPCPPPPPAGSDLCCSRSCTNSNQCAPKLFCCPNHGLCMDGETYSTAGDNCDACMPKTTTPPGTPGTPPPTTKPTTPPGTPGTPPPGTPPPTTKPTTPPGKTSPAPSPARPPTIQQLGTQMASIKQLLKKVAEKFGVS